MRAENARLGVETTTKNDLTARSATYPRSRSSNDQRQSARADREWLGKSQQGGPRMGSSSKWLEKCQQGGPRMGSSSHLLDSNRCWIKVGAMLVMPKITAK